MRRINKTKLAMGISIVLFIVLAGAWPYLDTFLPKVDARQIVAPLSAIVFAMFLYLDARLDELRRPPTSALVHGQLSDLLPEVLKSRRKPLRSVEVFAFTTGIIQPIFSNSGTSASKVRVIVVDPAIAERLMPGFAGEVELKVRAWEALKKSGAVGTIEIRYIDYLPTDYFVLVEGNALIAGTYAPNVENSASPVDVYSPFSLHDDDAGAAKVVSQYQVRFEALWKGAHVLPKAAAVLPPLTGPAKLAE